MDLTYFDNLCHTINQTLYIFVADAEGHKHGLVEEFYYQRQRGMLGAIREHNDGVVEAVRKAAAQSPSNRYMWQCSCGITNDITSLICMNCKKGAPVLGKKEQTQ